MSGRKRTLVGPAEFLKANKVLGIGFALCLFVCSTGASAQTGEPSTQTSSPSASEDTQAARPGIVIGTILDQSGAVSVGTVIRLTPEDKSAYREVTSGDNGQFSFSSVPVGHFQLSVNSTGFGNELYSGDVAPGQTVIAPPIVLSVATVVTQVKVTVDPVEVATEEVKEQEHQRVLGFIPNFYTSYNPDAAPLTTKLKYHLAWKSMTDVVSFGGVAFLAGLQQASDEYSEYGQGAQGYAKRFGADYGDAFTSTFLSGAVFPSLFKQDPRYYYQGTGSTKSRILHAVGNSVWCKGDNGHWQVNYSNMAGAVSGAALASTYYPSSNQGMNILTNSFIRMGESSLTGVIQEFILRRLTKTAHRQDSPATSPNTASVSGSGQP